MRVKFGGLEFTKCKFSALDGKTVVTFKTDDEAVQGRADSTGVDFKVEVGGSGYEGVEGIVKMFGELLDATYKEHVLLKPKLVKTLSGH